MDPDARLALPDPPGLGGALREGGSDFYFNSWRLVPANIIWAMLLIVILLAGAIWLPALGLLCVLSVPVAGLHRMAAQLARGHGMSFSDFIAGMRQFGWLALAIGLAAALLAVVFSVNVFIGLQVGGVVGWVFSALALYADIGLTMVLVALWPILVDPVREDMAVHARLRLAMVVVLARPGRMLGLTVILAVILLVSTLLFAVLLTAAVAYVSLVATRYVLPAADRLEGRPTVERVA